MTKKKVSESDLKRGIINMYVAMGKFCEIYCKRAERNIHEFEIEDMRKGYELETVDGDKYQLVLELKKV